jgi:uncharacterized protein YbjT (DUF2867 family)
MKVLVTGGTGFIGQYLCTELADRGHDVTALARSPDASGLPREVTVEEGDVTDRDSLDFAGQEIVVNLVALSPLFDPKGKKTHESVHLGGTRNVVSAAEDAGVSRIVQMSALGADSSGPTEYIRAKGKAEAVVKKSNLDWTIFRPSVVFGDGGEFVSFTKKLTPPVVAPMPGGGRTRFQPIWVKDLVSMLADTVEDDSHTNEIYEIGGPEVLTLAEVAKLSRGGGVTIIPVPMALTKIGMTVAGPVPFVPFGPDQARSLEFDNTTPDNDIAAFGASEDELLTLAEYLNGQ